MHNHIDGDWCSILLGSLLGHVLHAPCERDSHAIRRALNESRHIPVGAAGRFCLAGWH
jgi:hypothetical protein